MRAVIIDDEQLAVELLKTLLNRIEDVEVVGTYTNPEEALVDLETKEIDVVFLDMEMGKFHGIQFAQGLQVKQQNTEIIYVTAHPNFAVEAFEVKALDYILKPLSLTRVEKAIQRWREKQALYRKIEVVTTIEKESLSATTLGQFHLLDLENNEVKWRTKKVKELFIYLWHHSPKPVHRSRILEDLWAELPEGRASTLMHTTVYQLRKAMKGMGLDNQIPFINEQYTFAMEIKSDINELMNIIKSTDRTEASIEKVLDLYKGNYLEVEAYEWTVAHQKKIKNAYLKYLEGYVQCEMENKNPSYLVENCLEKMIGLEPYDEGYIYLLIDYYGKIRNAKKMIDTVEKFKKIWIEELGFTIPKEINYIYDEYIRSVEKREG